MHALLMAFLNYLISLAANESTHSIHRCREAGHLLTDEWTTPISIFSKPPSKR